MDYFNIKWSRRLVASLAALPVLLAASIPSRPTAATPFSPASDDERVQYRPSERVRVVEGIVFARYDKRSLKLDLYSPVRQDGAAPGVIVSGSAGTIHPICGTRSEGWRNCAARAAPASAPRVLELSALVRAGDGTIRRLLSRIARPVAGQEKNRARSGSERE
jgi:hypothetical protein